MKNLICRVTIGVLLVAGLQGCTDSGQDSLGTLKVSLDNRYIVEFEDMADGMKAMQFSKGSVMMQLPLRNTAVVSLDENELEAFAANPAVRAIEVDARRYPSAQVTPYGITMVQADRSDVLDYAAASAITVCVIDSGYDGGHEDLAHGSNITTSPNSGTGNPLVDGCGHGTHVSGTISAIGNNTGVVGVNPNGNLNLHVVKVFGNDCAWAYSSSLIAALDACEAAGAKVVSMSLGGSTKSNFEDTAFAAAYSRGVLSIAAAGNDGNTRHSYPASYSSVISVAAIDDTKTVASFSQQTTQVELAAPGVGVLSTVPMGTGSSTALTVGGVSYGASAMDGAPFSSATGPLVECSLDGLSCPGGSGGHVCLIARGTVSFADKVLGCQSTGGAAAIIYNNAPGALLGTLGGIATTIPSVGVSDTDGAALLGQLGQSAAVAISVDNYAAWDGTSMATPHVSGVAALVWSHNPSWTNQEIRDALGATAEDLGAAGRDNAYGYGLVQAAAALQLLTGNGGGCVPTESIEVSCNDGLDNDCDGAIDGADSDCTPSCTITENPEVSCNDGLDNDCDGAIDANDSDCQSMCTLAPLGASCADDGDCCSNKCKGRRGSKTCR